MRTIKLNKRTTPRTRVGTDGINLYNGVDVNGGPTQSNGSIKWDKTPIPTK